MYELFTDWFPPIVVGLCTVIFFFGFRRSDKRKLDQWEAPKPNWDESNGVVAANLLEQAFESRRDNEMIDIKVASKGCEILVEIAVDPDIDEDADAEKPSPKSEAQESMQTADYMSLYNETAQLRKQLDACGNVAISTPERQLRAGETGWSESYQEVLELRRRYEKRTTEIVDLVETMVDEVAAEFENRGKWYSRTEDRELARAALAERIMGALNK